MSNRTNTLSKILDILTEQKSAFNSLLISVIPAIFAFIPDTREYIVKFFVNRFSIPVLFSEILVFILFFLPLAAVVIFWSIRGIIKRRYTILKVAIDNDSRGNRIEDFQVLREHAKKEILIMGIGLGYVSTDNSIVDLVQKGINVKFLIMDPDILIDVEQLADREEDEQQQKLEKYKLLSAKLKDKKMLIDTIGFNSFYTRADYRRSIENSIKNIEAMIRAQKERLKVVKDGKEGEIELRKYPYHIAMNVTISDIRTKDSKMVAEFCLPFTNERIRTKLDKGPVKELIEDQIWQLWVDATKVA